MKKNNNFFKWFLIGFLACLFFACRTPQQLIDKAIKKDPTIQVNKTDTLRLFKFVIDSVPVIINDSIVFEKFIDRIEYDTIINYSAINIERKKTRLEIRKNAKLERQRAKLNAKIEALKLKNERLNLRLTSKIAIKEAKEETKKERIKRRSFWYIWLLIGAVGALFVRYILNKRIHIKF